MGLLGNIGNAIGGAFNGVTHAVGGLFSHPQQQQVQPARGNLQVTQNPQVTVPHVNLNTMQTVHLQPFQPNLQLNPGVMGANPQAHFDFWGQYAKNLVDALTKHPAQLGHSNNPVINFAQQAIINPALRSPADIEQGIVKTGTGLGEAASGANLGKSATKTLQGAGQLGVGVLNSPLGFLAGGGKVVEGGVGGTTVAKTLIQGAKTGAAYGGAYGLASGLQQGKNLPDQVVKALQQGAINAGAGAAFGGALSGAGLGVGKAVKSFQAGRGAEAVGAASAVAPTPTIKGIKPTASTPIQKIEQAVGGTPPPSTPPVATAGGAGQERGFTTNLKTGKLSPNLTQETKDLLNSNYTPHSDQEIAANTNQIIQQGLPKAQNEVQSALNGTAKGALTDQQFHTATNVAYALDQAGQHDSAANILNQVAEHRTSQAQALRGAGVFAYRTPQSILSATQKAFSDAKITPSQEISDQISSLIKQSGEQAPGSAEKQMTVAKIAHLVNTNIPRGVKGSAIGIWRTGLISGPQTLFKVLVSQPFNTANHYLSQTVAGGADAAMTKLGLGDRTTTATMDSSVSGGVRGAKGIVTRWKTGITDPTLTSFGEEKIGRPGKVTRYEGGIMNAHASNTLITYGSVYDNAIARQAHAEAINNGLSGSAADKFINDFKINPSATAKARALELAGQATNQQVTEAGMIANKLQGAGGGAGNIIAPITRVPSAILTNALYNNSGVKLGVDTLRAVANHIKGGTFTPEMKYAIAQDIGKTAVGLGGVASTGAALQRAGMLTTAAPTDPKEKAIWQTEGKQPNSIKIAGHWLSLNSLGPIGLELGVGAGVGHGLAKGPVGAAAEGGATGLNIFSQQPYVQGIVGVGNAAQDPVRYGTTFVNKLVGSVEPGFLRQVAAGTDNQQRASYAGNPLTELQSGIPGFAGGLGVPTRSDLPAQHNLFGQTLPGAATQNGGGVVGGVLGSVNPFLPSKAINQGDKATSEIQRLYDTLGSQNAPAIAQPNKDKNIPALNNVAGIQNMIAKAGPQIHQGLLNAINNPTYNNLNDQQKSKLLDGIIQNSRSDAKLAVAGKPIVGNNTPTTSDQVYYQGDNGKLAQLNLAPKTATQKNSSVQKVYQLMQNGKIKPADFNTYINKLGVSPLQAEMTYARGLNPTDKGNFVLDKLGKYPKAAGTLAQNHVLTTGVATDLFNNNLIGPDAYRQLYAIANAQSKYDASIRKGGSGGGSGGSGSGGGSKSTSKALARAATRGPALRLATLRQPHISSNIKVIKTPRVTSTPKVRVARAKSSAKQIVLA